MRMFFLPARHAGQSVRNALALLHPPLAVHHCRGHGHIGVQHSSSPLKKKYGGMNHRRWLSMVVLTQTKPRSPPLRHESNTVNKYAALTQFVYRAGPSPKRDTNHQTKAFNRSLFSITWQKKMMISQHRLQHSLKTGSRLYANCIYYVPCKSYR